MATKRTTTRLETYEQRYRELARQLADVGNLIHRVRQRGSALQPMRERELWLS